MDGRDRQRWQQLPKCSSIHLLADFNHQWHLPLVGGDGIQEEKQFPQHHALIAASASFRKACHSYDTKDGKRQHGDLSDNKGLGRAKIVA